MELSAVTPKDEASIDTHEDDVEKKEGKIQQSISAVIQPFEPDAELEHAAAQDCASRWGGPFVSKKPFQAFMDTTTMHGFPRIFEQGRIVRKLFWLLAFSGFAVLFFTLTVASFTEFLDGKTQFAQTTHANLTLPLPGAIICPSGSGLRCDCDAWWDLACYFDPEVNKALYGNGTEEECDAATRSIYSEKLSSFHGLFLQHTCDTNFKKGKNIVYNGTNCVQNSSSGRFSYEHPPSSIWSSYKDIMFGGNANVDFCGSTISGMTAEKVQDLVVKSMGTGTKKICPYLTKADMLGYAAKRFHRPNFIGSSTSDRYPNAAAFYPPPTENQKGQPGSQVGDVLNDEQVKVLAEAAYWKDDLVVGGGDSIKECSRIRIPPSVANQTKPGRDEGLNLVLSFSDVDFELSFYDVEHYVLHKNSVEIYLSTNDDNDSEDFKVNGEPFSASAGYQAFVPLKYQQSIRLEGDKWNRHQDPLPQQCSETTTARSMRQCRANCQTETAEKLCDCGTPKGCTAFPKTEARPSTSQRWICRDKILDVCVLVSEEVPDEVCKGSAAQNACTYLSTRCGPALDEVKRCIANCKPLCTTRTAAPLPISILPLDKREVEAFTAAYIGHADDLAIPENVLLLRLGYAELEKVTTEESVVVGLASLLGTLGGNLGLWCGISFMTVMEALEYIIVMPSICRTRGCRDKKKQRY